MAKDTRVCNLCGKPRRSVAPRPQYPAFACARCYRLWKRTANTGQAPAPTPHVMREDEVRAAIDAVRAQVPED